MNLKLGPRDILIHFVDTHRNQDITWIMTRAVQQNSRGHYIILEGRRYPVMPVNRMINGFHCEFEGTIIDPHWV